MIHARGVTKATLSASGRLSSTRRARRHSRQDRRRRPVLRYLRRDHRQPQSRLPRVLQQRREHGDHPQSSRGRRGLCSALPRRLRPLRLALLARREKDKAWHFLADDDTWQDSYFSADNQVKSAELNFWLAASPPPTRCPRRTTRRRPARARPLQAQTGGLCPALGPHSAADRRTPIRRAF